MPRPKGSKNKKPQIVANAIENVDEKITATEAEIATLTGELKAKKAELKKLMKLKEAADRIAAEKKAEEEKATIMAALAASGKSVDEVIDFLKK